MELKTQADSLAGHTEREEAQLVRSCFQHMTDVTGTELSGGERKEEKKRSERVER